MVSTVSPNAKLTPRNPMPSVGKPAASTALPQPANVSQKVPKNSAPRRRHISMVPPLGCSLLVASNHTLVASQIAQVGIGGPAGSIGHDRLAREPWTDLRTNANTLPPVSERKRPLPE